MSNCSVQLAIGGILVDYAMMKLRIMSLFDMRRRICFACYVVAPKKLANFVSSVANAPLGITVGYASYGTTIPIRAYITVTIVESVEKDVVLERTSFIAR